MTSSHAAIIHHPRCATFPLHATNPKNYRLSFLDRNARGRSSPPAPAEESIGTKIKKIFAPTPTPAPRKHRKSSTAPKKKEGAEKSPTPKPSPTPEKSPSPASKKRKRPRVPAPRRNPSRALPLHPGKRRLRPSGSGIFAERFSQGRRSENASPSPTPTPEESPTPLQVRVPLPEQGESQPHPSPSPCQRKKEPQPPSRSARSRVTKSIRQRCARLSTRRSS